MTALGRESVLSTRTLSTASIPEGFVPPHTKNTGSSGLDTPISRDRWHQAPQDVEMADSRGETYNSDDAVLPAALPQSVANSLLFELPREIRERIYILCLTSHHSAPVQWPTASRSYHIQAQLLRTCKIIHNESAPLLYSQNCMTFHHPSDANMFVRAMSSVSHANRITNLDLHVKAQDTRLWMPYLTSTDNTRGLKSDFPNLREFTVRFRSSRWQHHHPPEANVRNWTDDTKLDEVIRGLRSTFLPHLVADPSTVSDDELEAAIIERPDLYQSAGSDIELIRKMVADNKISQVKTVASDAPKIKVCSVCRVNETHFNAITNPEGTSLPSTAAPVREGDPFTAFTAVDLQGRVKEPSDPDLGSASIARTPYANKVGVLIALEIHCLDPRKDTAERIA